MKNFDIEKLERKNSGEIPDGFFEEMQNNVLSRTIGKGDENQISSESKKTFSIAWSYGIAAVFIIVMGLVFLLPKNSEKQNLVLAQEKVEISNENFIDNPITDNRASLQSEKTQRTDSFLVSHHQNPKVETVVAKQKTTSQTTPSAKESIDLLLSEMSDKELADLGNRNYQDVYLDVYY